MWMSFWHAQAKNMILAFNQLTGSLPEFSSNNLEQLDLSYNALSGIIPRTAFSNLTSLTYIDLSYNKFGGLVRIFLTLF